MDLQEATVTMALLIKQEIDFHRDKLEPALKLSHQDPKQQEEMYRQFQWIKANTREFGNTLAANPHFFDVMESWMVTINGRDGVGKESIEEAQKTDDVDDLVDRSGGLAMSVKGFIKSKGYFICEQGAGEDGWDVGVRCSEKRSRDLCTELHQHYTHALNLKLLSISRRFAGHCLPGLYNWVDAERILLMYGQPGDERDLGDS